MVEGAHDVSGGARWLAIGARIVRSRPVERGDRERCWCTVRSRPTSCSGWFLTG